MTAKGKRRPASKSAKRSSPSKSAKRSSPPLNGSPRNGSARNGAVKKKRAEFSTAEVASLESQAAAHQTCERAWQKLAATEPGEEDRWAPVEEHLLVRSQDRDHASRRWKFFAK